MKHYDSFENIKYDTSLLGEEVWAFHKLDGQNFCVKYMPKLKEFTDYGSKKCNVSETHEQFGDTVRFFKEHVAEPLKEIILKNSGKRQYFNGATEVTFFFEWYGPQSFAGFHVPGDEMHLALIDVAVKKKGYIEPKVFWELFSGGPLEIPELVYRGKLTRDFVKEIQENDWTKPDCKYPGIKEGVVARRSTLMKGQRMPKVKIKTQWWVDKLHSTYSEDKWKELE